MSKFFSQKYSSLVPYTPGEQPQDKRYIKLNTNESPYPPSPKVCDVVQKKVPDLRLYSDPECVKLREEGAKVFGVQPNQLVMVNGSDEVLNFAFMAFADEKNPLVFPDITYGFYPIFAELNHIPYEVIPLTSDFSVNPNDYIGIHKTIVLANPNAPTGKVLPLCDIEKIVASNVDNVIIVDEAYVNFGGESAVCLIQKYDNLLVTGTFSKSRSMAGARLGFGIANEKLIADLNTIRYSTNPYNVNTLTAEAGRQAFLDNDYYMENCRKIIRTREYTERSLVDLGFEVLPSQANFLFAKSKDISGKELYEELKKKGILVRHFEQERIKEYNRISIGTQTDMETFIQTIKTILKEKK